MKKSNYKKILCLLGLSLALTACNKEEDKEIVIDCVESHLDKDNLNVQTLTDGSKYVKDADVLNSIREQFLKNNNILNLENVDTDSVYFEQLVNNTEYMHMFENSEIRKIIIWTMEQLQKIYPDDNPADIIISSECYRDANMFDDIYIYIPIKVNDKIYFFDFTSNLKDKECVDIDLESENIIFSKFMRTMNHSKDYDIIQSYALSAIEKTDLNKVNISISSNYSLNKDLVMTGIYLCEDFEGKLTLNNGEDKIEVDVSEEQYNQLATLLTNAAKQDKMVSQFLEENKELMIELYGKDYLRFIEITQSFTYVKKPV